MNRQMVVHQFTVDLRGRDAVGNHTMQVDEILRELGADTTLYASHADRRMRKLSRDFRYHATDPAPDLIIYQASIGSVVADYLLTRNESLVINYHNITPAEPHYKHFPHLAAALDLGRQQLARLCRKACYAVADSEFNAGELRRLGIRNVSVVPPLLDGSVLPSASESDAIGRRVRGGRLPDLSQNTRSRKTDVVGKRLRGSRLRVPPLITRTRQTDTADKRICRGTRVTLLFVGRLAPNKRQEDLIATVAILRRWLSGVELVLVGSSVADSYARALKDFAKRIGVDDIVRFEGSVSSKRLAAWYRTADVFVCLSAHEGFCVPLVEAMAWGVPVVALESTAVPETLGSAGVLVSEPSPTLVATTIERVLNDQALRRKSSVRGLARAQQFSPGTRQLLQQTLEEILADNVPVS